MPQLYKPLAQTQIHRSTSLVSIGHYRTTEGPKISKSNLKRREEIDQWNLFQGNVKDGKKKENDKRIRFSMCINSNRTHLHFCTPGDFKREGFSCPPIEYKFHQQGPRKNKNVCHVYIVEKYYSPKEIIYITGPQSNCLKGKKKKSEWAENEHFKLYKKERKFRQGWNRFCCPHWIRNVVKYGISLNHHMGTKSVYPKTHHMKILVRGQLFIDVWNEGEKKVWIPHS